MDSIGIRKFFNIFFDSHTGLVLPFGNGQTYENGLANEKQLDARISFLNKAYDNGFFVEPQKGDLLKKVQAARKVFGLPIGDKLFIKIPGEWDHIRST